MPALRRLVAGGTQAEALLAGRSWKPAYKAAIELYDETSAANPKFKKVYDCVEAVPRTSSTLWFRVAENTFDNFVYSHAAKKSS